MYLKIEQKLGITILALMMGFAVTPARAISIVIDDRGETMTATPGFGGSIVQEGNGILGDVSYHFEYITTDPNIPAEGVTRNFNVNWWEGLVGGTCGNPSVPCMSDTLSVAITGHNTTTSNVSIDLSFLSGSLDDLLLPTPLLNPNVNITEPAGFVTYNPLSDLSVTIASEVPEPGTLSMMGIALGALAFASRKFSRKPRASV